MDVFIIKRLEQARLLSDPFKLKLLEGFAGKPATTKQVADRMGEKAPRLYRHVDALVEEGLLKLVEEKPKRGTVERYYKTIASRFEVDPELFSPSSSTEQEGTEFIRSIFRDTESELLRYYEKNRNDIPAGDESPVIVKLNIRASPGDIDTLREKLQGFLDECTSISSDEEPSDDDVSYSAFLAFFPQSGND